MVRQKNEGKTIEEMERYWHHCVLLYPTLKNENLFLELQPKEVWESNNLISQLNDRFNHKALVINATNLRRSAREKGVDKVKSNVGQFMINMEFKGSYWFLFSRKDDYMKSLFQSWNKSFSSDLSLKNHQEVSIVQRAIKRRNILGHKKKRNLIKKVLTNYLTTHSYVFKVAHDLDMKCNTKRAPYGALEEIDNENLEEFSVNELQDVMVNLQKSDIFYNKFMYNKKTLLIIQ